MRLRIDPRLTAVGVRADGLGVIVGVVASEHMGLEAAESGGSAGLVLVKGNHLATAALLDHLGRAEGLDVGAGVIVDVAALDHLARAVVAFVELKDGGVGSSNAEGEDGEELHFL